MRPSVFLSTIAISLAVAASAHAQVADPADTTASPPARHATHLSMQQRFDAANTTHDGKLTLEQAKEGMPRVARHFSAIDKESKGYVTLDEIHEYNAAQHKAHAQHQG